MSSMTTLSPTLAFLECGSRMSTGIRYESQTKKVVTVSYNDLPFPTDIWIVNKVSANQVMMAGALAGSGSLDLKIDALPTGDYFVLARNGGHPLVQTIVFHVANP